VAQVCNSQKGKPSKRQRQEGSSIDPPVIVMALLLSQPAGGGGGPQQRGLPVYAWLLLWALVVSIGSMFRQNLTSFYNDVAVPLPAAGIVVGGDLAHNHTTTTTKVDPQVDPRRRTDQQQTPLVVDDHASSSASQQQEITTPVESSSSSIPNDGPLDNGGTTTTTPPPPQHKPLNIVLLYADDWSYSSLGVAGNSYVQTPRLDDMAKSGIYFTHNCVTSSICMQSRATLYTGQYASKHQTFFAYRNVTMYGEGRWNQTLYPLMKKAGYHIGVRMFFVWLVGFGISERVFWPFAVLVVVVIVLLFLTTRKTIYRILSDSFLASTIIWNHHHDTYQRLMSLLPHHFLISSNGVVSKNILPNGMKKMG
jgi:hypothetical protein